MRFPWSRRRFKERGSILTRNAAKRALNAAFPTDEFHITLPDSWYWALEEADWDYLFDSLPHIGRTWKEQAFDCDKWTNIQLGAIAEFVDDWTDLDCFPAVWEMRAIVDKTGHSFLAYITKDGALMYRQPYNGNIPISTDRVTRPWLVR